MSFLTRVTSGWNAFMNRDPPKTTYTYTSSSRPDTVPIPKAYERSIINSIINRISIDVSQVIFCHAKVDDDGKYVSTIDSELNKRLTLSANKDQIGQEIMQDFVNAMLVDRVAALVPIDTDTDPLYHDGFKINSLRVGKIIEWRPDYIRVDVYNDRTGKHEEIWVPKESTVIVENPFATVMNEPNSTFKRLIRKLALLDAVDEESSSGKLNVIIQLPYTIRSDARKQQAEDRRKELQQQLAHDKYGVGYTDGTEKIVQLNRPIENNLLGQIKYLTELAFSQLSMTQGVLDGTANDDTMSNYFTQIIQVIAGKIATEMTRKFLSRTAISQKQKVLYYRDLPCLLPISKLSDVVQGLTTAAIISSNEVRQLIGRKPSEDKHANELSNKNITPGGDTSTALTEQTDENEYPEFEGYNPYENGNY